MKNLTQEIEPLIEEYKRQNRIWHWATELNLIIGRTTSNYEAHYNEQHKEQEITHPSLSLLYVLLEHGGEMPQKQLTSRLPVTKQAIATSLRTLEKRGLVVRKTIDHDRRKRRVRLTEKGISLLDSSLPLRGKFYTKLLGCISEDEGKNLIATLGKLNRHYEREISKLDKDSKQAPNS